MALQESTGRLVRSLSEAFEVDPAQVSVVFAPYRICPLGAHIDHQAGPVTAMALDQGTLLAFAPLPTPEVRMRSMDFPGEVHFRFDCVPEKTAGDWGNYLRGAVRALEQHYPLKTGLVGITQGRVSEGGLSSSAAVGVAYLLALETVNQLTVEPIRNVMLDRHIENVYLGLQIGILDQSAILLSRQNHLTWIDCATACHQLIPRSEAMPPFSVLIAFSGLRKPLTGTDYNQRVNECSGAATILLRAAGRPQSAPLLGNVTAEQYQTYCGLLNGQAARRAAHFFSEVERVRRGVEAWRKGDLQTFGTLISESGASSIHNYECGAPPLIDLYQRLTASDGVYGARFSGAGFRGCCLALVEPAAADQVAAQVRDGYAREFPALADDAWTMVCQTGSGASIIS